MKKLKLGVQLYTLRDEIKDPKNIDNVFKFIKSTGAESVELSAMPKIGAKEVAKIAKDNGLEICSTHSDPLRIKDDLDLLIEEHLIYGCPTIGLSSIPSWFNRRSLDDMKAFCDFFNKAQEKAKTFNLYMHYHNHDFEFKALEGFIILDFLQENLREDIGFCLDLYWIKVGGASIDHYMQKIGKRVTQIHMKGHKKTLFGHKMCAPSSGSIDYIHYLKMAESFGTKDALIEIDTIKNPRQAISESMQYLIECYRDI